MTEKMRLLDKTERIGCVCVSPTVYYDQVADVIQEVCLHQAKVTQEETLKAVEKWLEMKVEEWASFQGYKVVSLGAIESLLRGQSVMAP